MIDPRYVERHETTERCEVEVQHGGAWSWWARCERRATYRTTDGAARLLCTQHAKKVREIPPLVFIDRDE